MTKTLHDAFIDELRDVYDAEQQLVQALPKMAKTAIEPELMAAFESHLMETEQQVARLGEVFALLQSKVRTERCAGMAGIIEEAEQIIDEDYEDATRDACLIACAQRAEHYEIAAYGTLIAWARSLGHPEAVTLLEETLNEEKAADEKLSSIAEGEVNPEAVQDEVDAHRSGDIGAG